MYEVESDGTTKRHVFAGANRVCTVTRDEGRGTTDASYYHSDHLGSSNVITDSSGQQVAYYEYTPYGTIAVQEIVSRPSPLVHHLYTGKELDNIGLYFYGARYYDPTIGRFITADPTIQHPYDPQDLNRYSYCRNNPINYTDPTGLGWKKFWKKVEKWFKKEVLPPTIAFFTAFVFSGFNPIAGISAAIATASLDTGEGRQFMRRFGNEVFDDIFGMRPRTAYIWSAIASHIALTLGLETAITKTLYPTAKITNFDPNNPQDIAMLENPKGYDPFGRIPAKKGHPDAFDYKHLKTLAVREDRLAIIGVDVKQGGFTRLGIPVKHSGAISSNFPRAGMEGISVLGLKGSSIYATLFGTCHQATNQTFLAAGLANTVWSLGWESKAATIIYGNYGGGLVEKIYWGSQYANED